MICERCCSAARRSGPEREVHRCKQLARRLPGLYPRQVEDTKKLDRLGLNQDVEGFAMLTEFTYEMAEFLEFRDMEVCRRVMRRLVEAYPGMILWGSDSPAYSYMVHRRQGEGDQAFETFSLKGTYEGEVMALASLPAELRQAVCNGNTLRFLFGGS